MESRTESTEIRATFHPKDGEIEPWTGTLRETITTKFVDDGGEQTEGTKSVSWDRPSPDVSFGDQTPAVQGELDIDGRDGVVEVFWSSGRFNETTEFRQ